MKVTNTVQDFLAANVDGHKGKVKKLLLSLKPGLLMATFEILMLVVPVFARVTVFTASDPTSTWPKSTLEGEIVSADVVAELTVWLTPADVVGLKLASPGYEAAMVREPEVRKVNPQFPFPADSVALQVSPVVAVMVTVPVGLFTPAPVTLTLTVTA